MYKELTKKAVFNARNLAETMWGVGGTIGHRTTRRGASYYSCAGHGGYIVQDHALTLAEKEAIRPYITSEVVDAFVQNQNGKEVVLKYSFTRFGKGRRSRARYNPMLGEADWVLKPVWIFEEDCAWTVLEKFTDIRMKVEPHENPAFYASREANREELFQQYYGSKRS